MSDHKSIPPDPGPPRSNSRGHPLPRRTTPEKSVTLRHHRLTRDAISKAQPVGLVPASTTSPRRNSSGESYDTGRSDSKKWFDRSNRNPRATSGGNSVDVDAPFFLKESESSNEDNRLDVPMANPYAPTGVIVPQLRPTITQSSSADDYRSVIDDLTIENKRLKEELKRYKQFGTNVLRKDKLFEIKVHGLPRRKKRELEATLRTFAASLEGSSETPSQRKKTPKHANRLYSSGGSMSKHASSSSSQSRPVDSAYASMSTGKNSSGTSLERPSIGSRARSSEQKVEHYLEEIPEGLYPGFLPPALADKEKQKLVVKRLEQLFTGKITGHNLHRNQSMPAMETQTTPSITIPPSLAEPSREAYIQESKGKKNRSRDNLSTSNSNSNGDQTESGGNGQGSGGGGAGSGGLNTASTLMEEQAPEQRPTRPRDLDPDRVQIPSENMEYIRHLGLVAPELLSRGKEDYQDVSPDAEGWVYLNLLSNLAQLHIFNVSPDFIRMALSERSTKFQLSPDGRKIRWRGGSEGTKFTSDSSGDNSQRSPSTDEDDGSDKPGQHKRLKTADGFLSVPASKNHSRFGPQTSGTSGSFHYKPLFVHHRTSSQDTSVEDTGSQDSYQVEDSNLGISRWNYSGSGSSPRKKRRADGAMVFYSGAPFCTDLSGDPGDVSPTTYMTSTGQRQESSLRPETRRSPSGDSIPYRPLADKAKKTQEAGHMEVDTDSGPDFTTTADVDDISDIENEFPWCDDAQKVVPKALDTTLEPSGIGRVFPEDHFAVMVTTRRPCLAARHDNKESRPSLRRLRSNDTTTSLVGRLATMSTSPSLPYDKRRRTPLTPVIKIEYLSGRIRRLKPEPLPPPAVFYPPFSSSSSSEAGDDSTDSDEDAEELPQSEILTSSAEEVLSKKANPHHSDNTYPDAEDFSSGDEEDEASGETDNEMPDRLRPIQAPSAAARHPGKLPTKPRRSRSASTGVKGKNAESAISVSSAATAGGAKSGYNSSMEDD